METRGSGGQHLDDTLTTWQSMHEKSMCVDCRAAVPQKLYCVHPDCIRQTDKALAAAEGLSGSARGGGRGGARMHQRREQIATELWSEFMLVHPDHVGPLSDTHMRAPE
jgi:hypothetical protein